MRTPKAKYYAVVEGIHTTYSDIPMNAYFAIGTPSLFPDQRTEKGNAYIWQHGRLYPLFRIEDNTQLCHPHAGGMLRSEILKSYG